jgi:hypothetical protein
MQTKSAFEWTVLLLRKRPNKSCSVFDRSQRSSTAPLFKIQEVKKRETEGWNAAFATITFIRTTTAMKRLTTPPHTSCRPSPLLLSHSFSNRTRPRSFGFLRPKSCPPGFATQLSILPSPTWLLRPRDFRNENARVTLRRPPAAQDPVRLSLRLNFEQPGINVIEYRYSSL